MCSPGCFSLFRGSALMDDHVLRTYCTKSREARHYVQYDQGELKLPSYNIRCCSGVGLYTIKRIIENYGGQITVESQEGQGTTFQVLF